MRATGRSVLSSPELHGCQNGRLPARGLGCAFASQPLVDQRQTARSCRHLSLSPERLEPSAGQWGRSLPQRSQPLRSASGHMPDPFVSWPRPAADRASRAGLWLHWAWLPIVGWAVGMALIFSLLGIWLHQGALRASCAPQQPATNAVLTRQLCQDTRVMSPTTALLSS